MCVRVWVAQVCVLLLAGSVGVGGQELAISRLELELEQLKALLQ